MTDNEKHISALAARLQQMPAQDFAQWGVDQIAYVKPTRVGKAVIYTIHAADGQPLAQAATYDLAAASIVQNDLEPVTLH